MTITYAKLALKHSDRIVHESDEAEANGTPFSPWTRLRAVERMVELRAFLEQARKREAA
jgi:hypothetical protein